MASCRGAGWRRLRQRSCSCGVCVLSWELGAAGGRAATLAIRRTGRCGQTSKVDSEMDVNFLGAVNLVRNLLKFGNKKHRKQSRRKQIPTKIPCKR